MDQLMLHESVLSFSYPVILHDGIESNQARLHKAVADTLRKRCDELMKTYKCNIIISSVEPQYVPDENYLFSLHSICIIGAPQQILSVKGVLLRQSPTQVTTGLL